MKENLQDSSWAANAQPAAAGATQQPGATAATGATQAQPTARGAKRANAIIVVALFVVALAAWLITQALFAQASAASGGTAVVHTESGVAYELPLSADATQEVQTDGGVNVVCVEAGQVYVFEADCPGHDCMGQGRIDSAGQTIVCLPHKLWIEVVFDGEDAQFDTIGS